jgi:hypothetical protein
VNGTKIEFLRDLIEHTLQDLGMPESPWVCTVDGSTPRQLPRSDDRGARPGVRVVWHKDRNELEFFDEVGRLLRTVGVGQSTASSACLVS